MSTDRLCIVLSAIGHLFDGLATTAHVITQNGYNAYRTALGFPVRELADIEEAERLDIYRRRFWIQGRCQEMPEPLAGAFFGAVMCYGLNDGVRLLCAALRLPVSDRLEASLMRAVLASDAAAAAVALLYAHHARLATIGDAGAAVAHVEQLAGAIGVTWTAPEPASAPNEG